jgi:hypothetical protein
MEKLKENRHISFETFLKSSLTVIEYEQIPISLGLSKKMFTIILREPGKLGLTQIKRLSEIIKKPIESITDFID